MLDLLEDLVGALPHGCDLAEARHVVLRSEALGVRDGRVDRVDAEVTEGIGVRVHVGGAWGFAATSEVTPAGARGALARAIAVAAAQPRPPRGARAWAQQLAPAGPPARGHWASALQVDPFAVSLDDRLALLLATVEAMGADARLVRREAECRATALDVAFASSDGAACTQRRVSCGAGLSVLAVDDDEAQVRSYPSAHGGSVVQAGWEHVLGLDLAAHAPRAAEEAVALLSAPECPEATTTLVIGAEQLALQIHESVGHALELDRILGGEASYAGTSWVTPADVTGGALRYGSPLMHVTADATLPGALGTFGWDDEGVAGRRDDLVRDGVLVGALSDRTSAGALDLPAAGGCARAADFSRQPIVRMTNVSLEPGDAGSLEDLLADTGEGLYVETNRSWSIDDRRLHFRFGTEVAYEIRGGERGRLLRNASYSGRTPAFWGSLDAVGSSEAWELHGVTNCGKGEPGQMMAVSHGAAPARFRDVSVAALR